MVRLCLQKDAEDRPTFDYIVAMFAVAAFCPVPPLGRVALETEVDASGPAADPAGNADVNPYRVVAALPSLIGHGQIQVQEPFFGPGHADVNPYSVVAAPPSLIGHGQIQVQEPYVGPGHADIGRDVEVRHVHPDERQAPAGRSVVPYRVVSAMPAAAHIYVDVVHPHPGPAADN